MAEINKKPVIGKKSQAKCKLNKVANLYFFEYQTAVCAAKTKIIFQCVVNFNVAGGISAEIQIAFWVLVKDINGWR
jgi:hypothetical protein